MSPKTVSRREFLRLSAAAAGVMGLAACAAPAAPTAAPAAADSTKAPAGPTSAPAPAGPATIEYLMYDLGPANKSREDLAKIYKDVQPNTEVKITVLPYLDIWTKLSAMMAAGTPPDIVYSDFSVLRYAIEGQLIDLKPYFDADPVLTKPEKFTLDLTDKVQAYLGTNKMVHLTLGSWVPAFYYNKDIFDAAGEPYPAEGWTWADVRAAAKRLTDPAKEQYGLMWGHMLDNTGWMWWNTKPEGEAHWSLPQIYPDKTGWDTRSGREVMQIIRDMADDKSMVPFSEAAAYQVYAGAFGAGKCAMYSGGDWDAGWSFRELPFKWDLTMTPTVSKEYRAKLNCMVATHCITTGSKFLQAAWDYIRFITATPEGQALIGEGAYETPVLKEVAESEKVMQPSWAPAGYGTRTRAMRVPDPMYTPYQLSLNLYEYHDKFMQPTLEKLTLGEMSVEDAVKLLDREGATYFADLKKQMPAAS